MSEVFNQLGEIIKQIPIFSTHQHHLEMETHQNLDLDSIFSNSYVSWCSLPKGSSIRERQDWLDSIRHNSYFSWLEKALSLVYGIEHVTVDNWDRLSLLIRKAHQENNYHLRLLKEKANFIGFLEDCYWNPGSDLGYPDFISPVYRIDMWLYGFHPESLKHYRYNPHKFYGYDMPDFDTYVEKFKDEVRRRRTNIVALKCAVAYGRTIRFESVERSVAKNIYGKHPTQLNIDEQKLFVDYMFHVALELAEQLDLPIQIHTGLAQLEGSSPLNLENVIARYPRVRFVLFHGGFPWIYETAGIAHNYDNVILDINWLPLISTTAAIQALPIYMEALRDNQHITWGADTWTSEEAIGAAMAFRHVLAIVLSRKVEQRYFLLKDAENFAEKIMYTNAQYIYGK